MKTLSVDVRSEDDGVTLVLSGELDLSTAPTVERELAEAERDRPALITIDLRGVTFLDSTGLRVVLSADGRARKEDRRVEVIPGPPPVHRVFRIALLDRRITFVDPPEDGQQASEGERETDPSP
ncbi:MAG TPA: STAS domain-containing protein [Actinomycetota bacterium]